MTSANYPPEDKWFYEGEKYNNLKPPIAVASVIYKFIKLEYFLSILKANKLRVEKISSWEDPFENILFKCNCRNAQGERVSLANLQQSLYGQSFTNLAESDALWRIYSSQKDCIRLSMTAGGLFDALYGDGHANFERTSLFIAEVNYSDENEIIALLSDEEMPRREIFSQEPNKFIFLKRKAFEHEKEVRLVFQLACNHKFYGQPRLEFDIDPNMLFSEVLLDPRLDADEVQKIELSLRNNGYRNGVSQSKLYGSRTFDIKI
ncbi:MAG TPA: DUF2971 domain-containing protein [Candidatus Rifleibacterium sp.]|nr:DUF2971 domain-containing protein [Candidatus Rifleibacterium sp.]